MTTLDGTQMGRSALAVAWLRKPLIIVLLCVAWEVAVRGLNVNPLLFPPFSDVARHLLAGLGRHTLAIYLLHLPVQALLVELGLYDLMRGKATIVVVLWSVLLAAVTLAVLNLSPVQRACDAVANCWYKRK